ncbi:hypothetical protein MBLNU230_g1090t1 [Neophaeotheca triangularis]
MAKKKNAATQDSQSSSSTPAPPQPSSLSICRNKHWKYISSYHGPWLQLPAEILDQLAHQNFTMPAPRLIDPAVFYDVVKIRKAVDEASEDSVRASTGLSNSAMNGRMDYLGAGGGGGQLSKERVFRIRQKAVKNLSKAFTLDEVAASVASMQATSTIEDVGSHVLKREPQNIDALYVHFFHEKIPSRAMEHFTPLEPLDDILGALPIEMKAPQLRTRALVQNFKQQWEGSVIDLTNALRIVEENKKMHKPNQQELELASKMRRERGTWNGGRDWRNTPQLKEEDQPTSLEQQLLFNRGGVYLKLACQSVDTALNGLKECLEKQEAGEALDAREQAEQAERLEARKKVRGYAKRALKDYMGFLSFFDYTPGLSFETTNEIMRRVYDLANGNKVQKPSSSQNRLTEVESSDEESLPSDHLDHSLVQTNGNGAKQKPSTSNDYPHIPAPKVYPTSALFAEKQPTDLPTFPSAKMTAAMQSNDQTPDPTFNSREAVTYHPLLTDALHSLLLSHALCQTSPTEHLRHAHNVARIARIADGYPIFQAARSPARADWIEVLRRANNWLGLSVSWQKLCAPAPLPDEAGGWAKDKAGQSSTLTKRGGAAGSQRNAGVPPKDETPAQKRERIKQESILDALSDDRVVDEESFNRAVRARERRAMDDEEGLSGPLRDRAPDSSNLSSPINIGSAEDSPVLTPADKEQPKRWAQEEGAREYPISTDRAEAVVRWIKEAPVSIPGTGTKKKRRPARKRAPVANGRGVAEAVGQMNLDGGVEQQEEGPD